MVMYVQDFNPEFFTTGGQCYGGSYCTWASLFDAGTCYYSHTAGDFRGNYLYPDGYNNFLQWTVDYFINCCAAGQFAIGLSLFSSISVTCSGTGTCWCRCIPTVCLCIMDKFICTKSTDYVVAMDAYLCAAGSATPCACVNGMLFNSCCCYPVCIWFCKVSGTNCMTICDICGARTCTMTQNTFDYRMAGTTVGQSLTITPTKIQLISGSAYWWKCMTF